MKENDVKASFGDICLAAIADRLGAIVAWALGTERPDSIVESLLGETFERQDAGKNTDIEVYETPEDFTKARYGE